MQIVQGVAKTYWYFFFKILHSEKHSQTQLKRGRFFVIYKKATFLCDL